MRDSGELRARAARLRALANRAREDGKFNLAGEIEGLATEASNQADEFDRSKGAQRRHQEPQQAQQQSQHQRHSQQRQQPQNKDDKE